MSRTEKTEPEPPPTDTPEAAGELEMGGSCWWQRKWLLFAAIFVFAVVALGAGSRLALPIVLVRIGNRELPRHLAAPATLNAIDLGLFDYRATLRGLKINQPDGFGNDLFLDLPEVGVKLVPSSLFGSPLTIEEVNITDLSLHVVRGRDGALNVVRLFQPAVKPAPTEARKPLHIKRIAVGMLTIRYTDFALAEEPADVMIKCAGAVITDVYLNVAGNGENLLPGRAELTGFLVQPGMADAPLGIIARFGHIDPDQPIPAGCAALRLAGLELQPWHALLPQKLSQTLGGDITDVNVDAAISTDALDCIVALVTPAGDSLKLQVGGTPRQPQVERDDIRGIVADRAREAGMNTLGNIGGTGEELGRTALSTAATAGKGAATTVWETATGLFKTASSVSKGDIVVGGADLFGTLRGVVTNAGNMVGDTGTSLITGGVQTASAVGGGDRNELWRADTQQRWARNWEQARKSVDEYNAPGHGARRLADDEHLTDLP
ncbi:MAG: hypothetical protein RBU25_16335 [Lentisphaeria bacterium]|jgi:hypothetical protein|nr:hypothetical protein [Lentisphaeria bacterium]